MPSPGLRLIEADVLREDCERTRADSKVNSSVEELGVLRAELDEEREKRGEFGIALKASVHVICRAPAFSINLRVTDVEYSSIEDFKWALCFSSARSEVLAPLMMYRVPFSLSIFDTAPSIRRSSAPASTYPAKTSHRRLGEREVVRMRDRSSVRPQVSTVSTDRCVTHFVQENILIPYGSTYRR